MGTNNITILIKDSPAEAPNYNTNGEGFKMASLDTAIVVRKGTVEGNATVDLQFTAADGTKYVAMVTAAILKTVTDVAMVKP